jgi:hypothetical protein
LMFRILTNEFLHSLFEFEMHVCYTTVIYNMKESGFKFSSNYKQTLCNIGHISLCQVLEEFC